MTLTRPYLRVALLAVFVSALTLSGCGRKGPLDPPPAASLAGDEAASNNAKAPPVMDKKGRLVTPPGPNKPIPLDVLLN